VTDYSMTTLGSIQVIWRRPDTMELWGIPYPMRPGQSPRDLYEGRKIPDTIRAAQGWRGAMISAPGVREDWIYLGAPGWWGSLTEENQRAVTSWLDLVTDGHPRLLPQGPGEWIDLMELAVELARRDHASGPTGAEEPDDE